VAVTNPAVPVSTITQPKWFNGNWMVVEHYGDPSNSSGMAALREVEAQKKAYADAKKFKGGEDDNLAAMVSSSFWTSVQAWAYNNYGHRLIAKHLKDIERDDKGRVTNMDKLKPNLEKAKSLLLAGLDILDHAPELGTPANDAQKAGFEHEVAQRRDAKDKLDSNLLFVKRWLGEEPWPSDNE
jgi:hypothetical protein